MAYDLLAPDKIDPEKNTYKFDSGSSSFDECKKEVSVRRKLVIVLVGEEGYRPLTARLMDLKFVLLELSRQHYVEPILSSFDVKYAALSHDVRLHDEPLDNLSVQHSILSTVQCRTTQSAVLVLHPRPKPFSSP